VDMQKSEPTGFCIEFSYISRKLISMMFTVCII